MTTENTMGRTLTTVIIANRADQTAIMRGFHDPNVRKLMEWAIA